MKVTESTLKTTIVSSEDERNTYEVRKEFVGIKGKTAVIVLLYPGIKASEAFKTDDTARALIEHMNAFNISCLRIVNLFSKVSTARISTRNLAVDTENLEYISSIVAEKDSDDYLYIIAWGSSMSKSSVSNASKRKILEIIQKGCPKAPLLQLSARDIDIKCQNAIHPLWLKIRNSNSEWILEPYIVPAELKANKDEKVEKNQVDEEQEETPKKVSTIYKVEPKKKK